MRNIVKLYVNQFLDENKSITIEQVPSKLREEVKEELKKLGIDISE